MKSFKQMIQGGEIKRHDAMKIRLCDIHEEPGFNLRTEGEELAASIEELATHIMAGGMVPALEVRPREDGGVWIVDGHRRSRAYRLAVERGAPIEWINVVAFSGNDADRLARVITSAEGRALQPIEVAQGVKRLMAFGLDASEVAANIGKSVQRVNQLLELANANTDVQKMVAAGGVSAAVATKVVREHGDNAGAVLAEAAERAKADGKTKVTPKTLAKDKPKALPAAIANELLESGFALSTHLPIEAHRVLAAGVSDGVESIANLMVSVPAGFLLELVNAVQAGMDFKGGQIERILMAQEASKQQPLEV